MCTPALETFVEQFRNLWRSGYDAHLDAHTHAGEAWVNLRVRLGHAQVSHSDFTSNNRNRNGPARQRRRSRRSAERAAKAADVLNKDLTSTNAEEAFEAIDTNENVPEPVKNISETETDTTEIVEIVVEEEVSIVIEETGKDETEEVDNVKVLEETEKNTEEVDKIQRKI